jgi:Membrane bound FAD containing D-sorbitol dehydrogenase
MQSWFCGDQMQFDRLKGCKFIPPVGSAAAPSRRTRVERQDSAAGSPHRRELLRSLLVAALAAAAGWDNDVVAASLPLERDRFVGLSERLCAMSIEDGSLADAIQNALVDRFTDDEFRRIAELLHSATPQEIDRLVASSGLDKLAKSIISVWYSGLLGTGETTRVLAYEDALAWRATGYAKAPGTCGEFGDWITKPSTALAGERRP